MKEQFRRYVGDHRKSIEVVSFIANIMHKPGNPFSDVFTGNRTAGKYRCCMSLLYYRQ